MTATLDSASIPLTLDGFPADPPLTPGGAPSGLRWRTSAADLSAIGLAELNASAALLTRVDRKYVLSQGDLPAIWASLPDDARVLEIGGDRAFAYRSTYLDTPDLASFRASAQARRRRWKVRTRHYATGDSFLEVKTRRGASTVKERIDWPEAHRLADTGRLDAVGDAFVEDRLAAAGIALDAGALIPVLVTAYRRTTVYLPATGSRATCDTDLVWSTPDSAASRALTGRVVLETKSGSTPSQLDRTLWRLGHRPQRLSKYAVGLAALHPELSHNRWHRIVSTLGG